MSIQSQNENFYRFKIGRFNCISISDGTYDYNPRHIFPNMTEDQLEELFREHHIPADKITSPYSFLFVDTGNHKILADMGAGKLGPNTGKLVENLKLAGIQAEDIDTVIISHAHPDHIGGTLDDNGKPNYPNARYIMWKAEWDFWFSDEAVKKVDEHFSKFIPAEVFIKAARGQLGPVKDKMELITEESEILPGVHLHFAPGHTPGHMAISFSSEGQELFFTSDTVVFPFLLERPDLVPVFDMIPDIAAESKRKICNLVAEKNALVHAQHFAPFPSLGHIIKKSEAWQWQPIMLF